MPPAEADFVLRDFAFRSGESFGELRMHYRTFGEPRRDASGAVRNAVLLLHATNSSGAQFLRPEFSGALFGQGQLLDAASYFLVLPDGIGHGGSSKPSDGLRARFPHYGYLDMVEAQRRLLEEAFGVTRLRLVLGTSMGGMQTWLWGTQHPASVDALMPLACLPTRISGANLEWRREAIESICNDPAFRGGEYQEQPPSLFSALEKMRALGAGREPAVDETRHATADANDLLYALEASRDYDPGPDLERITAPLVAINTADDRINPPGQNILERAIARVPRGRAVIVPASERTRGHRSHSIAALWSENLAALSRDSSREIA